MTATRHIVFDPVTNTMSLCMADGQGHDVMRRDMAWARYVMSQDEFTAYCLRFFPEWTRVYLPVNNDPG